MDHLKTALRILAQEDVLSPSDKKVLDTFIELANTEEYKRKYVQDVRSEHFILMPAAVMFKYHGDPWGLLAEIDLKKNQIKLFDINDPVARLGKAYIAERVSNSREASQKVAQEDEELYINDHITNTLGDDLYIGTWTEWIEHSESDLRQSYREYVKMQEEYNRDIEPYKEWSRDTLLDALRLAEPDEITKYERLPKV